MPVSLTILVIRSRSARNTLLKASKFHCGDSMPKALGMESPQWNLDAFNKVFLADRDLMTKIVKETGITRES